MKRLSLILLMLLVVSPSYAVSLTNITNGSLGDAAQVMANDNALKGAIESLDGAQIQSGTIPGSAIRAGAQIPAEAIEGGTTNVTLQAFNSNSRRGVNCLYEAVGNMTVSAGQIMINGLLRSTTTSTDSAWTAASTTASGLDTGSESSGTATQYYVWVCADDPNATTFTVVTSLSATTPAYTGATNYRLIGQFVNDASDNINSVSDRGICTLKIASGKFTSTGTDTISVGFQPVYVTVIQGDATPATGEAAEIAFATADMDVDGLNVEQVAATINFYTTGQATPEVMTLTTTGFTVMSTSTYIIYYVCWGY